MACETIGLAGYETCSVPSEARYGLRVSKERRDYWTRLLTGLAATFAQLEPDGRQRDKTGSRAATEPSRRGQPCIFESLLFLAISEAYFSCTPSKSVELSLRAGSDTSSPRSAASIGAMCLLGVVILYVLRSFMYNGTMLYTKL